MASNRIMADASSIRATQERIFRIALRNGLTLKAISLDSEIPYNTLRSYAGHNGATAEMPVSALNRLVGVIPDDLLSLLLPADRTIVRVPEGIDHDHLADGFHDYLAAKTRAHSPASPDGERLSDCERATLDQKVMQLRGQA